MKLLWRGEEKLLLACGHAVWGRWPDYNVKAGRYAWNKHTRRACKECRDGT